MSDTTPALAAKRPDDALLTSVTLRLATNEDTATLVGLVIEAYEREQWLLPNPRTDTETMTNELASPQSRIAIAEVDGTIAGCIRVRFGHDGAWFGLLAVAPAMQGRGLASMLIAEAEAVARREGAATLRLECAEELGMPPYYASLGYALESREERVRFNRNDVEITRIVMRKALA